MQLCLPLKNPGHMVDDNGQRKEKARTDDGEGYWFLVTEETS